MAERFEGHRIPAILYAYSYETLTSAGLILTGGIIGLPPYHLGDVLGDPWVIYSILLGVFAVVAGTTTWVGLANWRKKWQAGVEQLGLWMTAGASIAYLFLLIRIEERLGFPTTGVVFLEITLVVLALSSVLRARAIRILQRRKLAELTVTNELLEETHRHVTPDPGTPQNPWPDHPRG